MLISIFFPPYCVWWDTGGLFSCTWNAFFLPGCYDYTHKPITNAIRGLLNAKRAHVTRDMIGGSKQFGMNKNVCHFSVCSLRCRNLLDVFRVGFSFQASVSFLALVFLVAQLFVIVRLLWHCQLSVCCVCVCLCVTAHSCLWMHWHISLSVGLCQLEFVYYMFVRALCMDLALVCLHRLMGVCIYLI